MVANRRLRRQGIRLQSLIILWERRPRRQRLPRATVVLRLQQQRTRQRPLGATSALGPRGYRLPPARARQARGLWVMVSRRLERIVGPAPSVVRQTASSRRPSRSLRTLLMAVQPGLRGVDRVPSRDRITTAVTVTITVTTTAPGRTYEASRRIAMLHRPCRRCTASMTLRSL